jgi:MFS family permease
MELKKTLLVAAISGIAFGILYFSLPIYLDFQGYDLSEIGWIFGMAVLLSGLLGIGIGALSDRFGRKPLIVFYNLMRAVGTLLIGWVPGIHAFILGKATVDFSRTHLWGAFVSRISDITKKKERGCAIGKYIAVFGTALSLTFVFSGYAIDNIGFHPLFSAAVLFSILAALFTFTFRESGKRTKKTALSLELLKTRNGRINSAISFCTGFSDALIYAYFFYIFLLREYSLSVTEVGLFTTGLFLFWSLASYFTGKATDLFGIRRTIAAGSLCNALVWVGVLFLWSDFWPFIFLLMLDNVSWALYGTGATKLSSVIPKRENIGRDVSVFSYSHIVGAMVGAFIAGTLADISYSWLFMTKILVMLAAAALVWYGIKLRE